MSHILRDSDQIGLVYRQPMATANKSVYVISDLHLGGKPALDGRGFRICTREAELAAFVTKITKADAGTVELVINGDSVDFLAESSVDAPERWEAFRTNEAHAVAILDRIAERSALFFQSLQALLKKGHRLVILPGNHDIELNLPQVRARLRYHVGASGPADYEFIPHGEAYRVGDVLIEHGNRVDDMNFVDQNELRTFCGMLSRCDPKEKDFRYDPPAGSKLVAELINDIKKTYSFIDLLKPEKEAAFPIILALEPGRRGDLLRIATALAEGKLRRSRQLLLNWTNISAGPEPVLPLPSVDSELDPLQQSLLRTVKRADFGEFHSSNGTVQEIGAFDRFQSFAALLFGHRNETWNQRLADLLAALRSFQNVSAFDQSVEVDESYADEASRLAYGPIRHVVFGHTHLAKMVKLGEGRFYFNSGTWADLLRLPKKILDPTRTYSPFAELEKLMKNLIKQKYDGYKMFHPTYVHFVQDPDGHSVQFELCNHNWKALS